MLTTIHMENFKEANQGGGYRFSTSCDLDTIEHESQGFFAIYSGYVGSSKRK